MDYFNNLFGPLDKDKCDYFFILSLIGLIAFISSVMMLLTIMVRHSGKKSFNQMMITSLMFTFSNFLIYFSNRIFYNMCLNSM